MQQKNSSKETSSIFESNKTKSVRQKLLASKSHDMKDGVKGVSANKTTKNGMAGKNQHRSGAMPGDKSDGNKKSVVSMQKLTTTTEYMKRKKLLDVRTAGNSNSMVMDKNFRSDAKTPMYTNDSKFITASSSKKMKYALLIILDSIFKAKKQIQHNMVIWKSINPGNHSSIVMSCRLIRRTALSTKRQQIRKFQNLKENCHTPKIKVRCLMTV